MQLQLATWPEVEAYLETSTGIIVPIGSTEQHGPTGLIGTDALTAEVIGRRVGEETGALVAPTVSIGMAQHHMSFKGSITYRPSTLILVVRDMVMSLARHGFDRFFFVNGHGGNIMPVNTAFSEIHAELAEAVAMHGPGANQMPAEVFCRIANWYQMPGVETLKKKLYGDKEGYHATPSEVAVTWYAFPDQRRDGPLDPIENVGREIQGAEDYRRRYPDGRMGADPSLAEPEHGKQFVETAARELAENYRKFLAGS
jgi:creatinine amidohydrolase